ncbi:MAG TPA: UDP-4-amino-4,6-dideoxy-N-acetyl-beta-L-altrosamine transaminase [Gammaproteobacteria bacterium]|nr:UDP-4-amino-4,6-dideoxy-N-acetyl-beta-L-altrosamine transaminase [Gammaproteobacteria bacterium]MBK83377.1 UDP-4-amino-4,6-dideoxy-N-acetyl-beta-L-altrosamine transaminase [Gammaproteobacteria bacterium]HBF08089.1 UDP-4-amino-4,6-dideoxy-N-acetyl-beta-L-altrosamine transaminase [Gammaproteobacteria bacterium]HCK91720.1 UDP-4-amino-4,6-dideoxy-N-acetyl-beta-L-altrosamine transaminase [Gammaproteobacteria bacterium]|tara:strand:+ start:16838 stop:17989 length:1152 start_codon:yes stop_codon:yes gene_type:complete
MIPYGRQSIDQQDIDAVIEVLKSDYLTQGPKVPEFEKTIQDYCNVNYAVACNSATSCLHIACLALGLGPGDLYWTSPISFVASANCALYCGAEVDFVEIDPQTYNMSVPALEAKLKEAKAKNRLPNIICPVHIAGQSCDMQAIYTLAQEYGVHVIEDASHAIGGRYQDKPIGDCRYSDITIFSFHPVKIITTGEGGVATTQNEELHHKMQMYRSHGVTKDPSKFQDKTKGSWYYEQQTLGYNYRMTDIQAALGISQFKKLDANVEKRQKIAATYSQALKDLNIQLPSLIQDAYSAYHLYIIKLKKQNHKAIFEALRNNNIGVNLHYRPIHLQPYYQNKGFKEGDFPISEEYAENAISIPMFSGLEDHNQEYVIGVLKQILSKQ